LLDKQDFQSHQVILHSNGNSLAMLILSGQESLEIVSNLKENHKERRGCAFIDHLKDYTEGCLPSAR
jgi:hypothetical protein